MGKYTFVRSESWGKTYLTREGLSGSRKYFTDRRVAAKAADEDAKFTQQHRYVIQHEDIYVVCSYSDVWDWFEGAWNRVVDRFEWQRLDEVNEAGNNV